MKIICAWCNAELGEKEPLEDKNPSHTICVPCSVEQFGLKNHELEAAEAFINTLSEFMNVKEAQVNETQRKAMVLTYSTFFTVEELRELKKVYSNETFVKLNRMLGQINMHKLRMENQIYQQTKQNIKDIKDRKVENKYKH